MIRGLLLVGIAATVAVLLNVLLLGRATAGNDPVGRLQPRVTGVVTTTVPAWTVRPRTEHEPGDEADD